MATINLVQLYLDTFNKRIVSVGGSPSTFPRQFQGDKPMFQIFPVSPGSSSPSQSLYTPGSWIAGNFAGYTMNMTVAPAPNAATPPASIASLDGMSWDNSTNSFYGVIDLTLTAVTAFIGNASFNSAWVNFDVFDVSLNRTTLYQSTSAELQLWASLDTPSTGPSGPTVQFLTVAQARNLYFAIAGTPGNYVTLYSQSGATGARLTLGEDGTLQVTPFLVP